MNNINEDTKFTLTLKQLRKLVNENNEKRKFNKIDTIPRFKSLLKRSLDIDLSDNEVSDLMDELSTKYNKKNPFRLKNTVIYDPIRSKWRT